MPSKSGQSRQLERNEVITASQMVTISQDGLAAFKRLAHKVASARIFSEPETTTKSVRFLAQAHHIEMKETSESSFIEVGLSKRSFTEPSEQGLLSEDKPPLEHPVSDSGFVLTDIVPSIILTDSEIEALAGNIEITLPGLEDTDFIPSALLITDARLRLLALPKPLLHNNPELLDEEEKRIIDTLNEWHEIYRINTGIELALAETAYCYDSENNRLIVRHSPQDATGNKNTLANQHVSNITEEIIQRLHIQKMGMQIHHCIPWIEMGWSSPHIQLKIKTENFRDGGATEEHLFDPRWNFSALSGNTTLHSFNVQSIWNWDDCGRYVTLGTAIGAFIFSKRGADKTTLTDADFKPYLHYIKSGEHCAGPKALRDRLMEFNSYSPMELSPTQQSPITQPEKTPYRALTRMSFIVADGATRMTQAAQNAYQGMRGGMGMTRH